MDRDETMAQIAAGLEEEEAPAVADTDSDEEAQLDAAAGTQSAKEQVRANLEKEENKDSKEGEEEEKGPSLADQAQATASKVGDAAGQIWDSVGRAATPGTILLPVAILLIFFFLLLPVNGNTRIAWLWQAMIGNAQIAGGGNAPAVDGSTDTSNVVPGTATGLVSLSAIPGTGTVPGIVGFSFTGVQL